MKPCDVLLRSATFSTWRAMGNCILIVQSTAWWKSIRRRQHHSNRLFRITESIFTVALWFIAAYIKDDDFPHNNLRKIWESWGDKTSLGGNKLEIEITDECSGRVHKHWIGVFVIEDTPVPSITSYIWCFSSAFCILIPCIFSSAQALRWHINLSRFYLPILSFCLPAQFSASFLSLIPLLASALISFDLFMFPLLLTRSCFFWGAPRPSFVHNLWKYMCILVLHKKWGNICTTVASRLDLLLK